MSKESIDDLMIEIMNSAKYRELDLPESTLRDLLAKELLRFPRSKEAVKEVRKKLHNIVAPYLGDPDYETAAQQIEAACQSDDEDRLKAACRSLLAVHASTRERLEILDEIYARLFDLTGQPKVILDLACALNPLTLPWMGLPKETAYYAYDIHKPRIDFLNRFFKAQGRPPLAIQQDILVNPPNQPADVVFIFKEVHRFEQRQKGCTRPLLQALNARYLLISLPPRNLTGAHDLAEHQRRLMGTILQDLPWKVNEVLFKNEMVFVVEKGLPA